MEQMFVIIFHQEYYDQVNNILYPPKSAKIVDMEEMFQLVEVSHSEGLKIEICTANLACDLS